MLCTSESALENPVPLFPEETAKKMEREEECLGIKGAQATSSRIINPNEKMAIDR